MMNRSRNIFWGIFLLCAAALVIVYQFGALPHVGIFSLILTILIIPVIIKSILHLNFFGVLLPAAVLVILYDVPLGLTAITPWPVLIAALLLGIGLSLIFRRRPDFHFPCHGHHDHFSAESESYDESEVSFSGSFGASSKYLNSSCLKKGSFQCSFGALKIFFDGAQLDPGGAEIRLECSFSGIELYIPRTWRVINNIGATLGGVSEKNQPAAAPGGPVLTLNGEVSFGGIEIIYI